ncbi:MAG TPA: nucleotide exchange factor GrpE [Acidimicrobiales bacterium]|nr:nucleotide exchange factor GrpE [Acidimicrobiales bacterium]
MSEPLDAVETDPEPEPPIDASTGPGEAGEEHGLVATEVPPEDARSDVERERDEYLDALRRLQADFENYKKRVDRQFEELSSRGATSLVLRLLPVLDTLDLAEEHLFADTDDADVEATAETQALAQARALLLDTLAKDGLERVGTAGEPFDPTVHDAVAHTDGEGGPVVDDVLRAGYRWRGQVLRPAMVKVKG